MRSDLKNCKLFEGTYSCKIEGLTIELYYRDYRLCSDYRVYTVEFRDQAHIFTSTSSLVKKITRKATAGGL